MPFSFTYGDPFQVEDIDEQSRPLLSEDPVDVVPVCSNTSSKSVEATPQSSDRLPLHQHHVVSIHPNEKNKTTQPNSGVAIPCRTVMPASTEAEWFKTLCELQTNLVKLRDARCRLIDSTSFSLTYASGRWSSSQPERAQDSSFNVRVLEELILSGMRSLSRIHPDALVKTEWASRADEFSCSVESGEFSGADVEEGNIVLSKVEGAATSDLQGVQVGQFNSGAAELVTQSDTTSGKTSLRNRTDFSRICMDFLDSVKFYSLKFEKG